MACVVLTWNKLHKLTRLSGIQDTDDLLLFYPLLCLVFLQVFGVHAFLPNSFSVTVSKGTFIPVAVGNSAEK